MGSEEKVRNRRGGKERDRMGKGDKKAVLWQGTTV